MDNIIEKYKAFWATGQKQFDEQKVEGVKYVGLLEGLYCQKENEDALIKELEIIYPAKKKVLKCEDCDSTEGVTTDIYGRYICIDCMETLMSEGFYDKQD